MEQKNKYNLLDKDERSQLRRKMRRWLPTVTSTNYCQSRKLENCYTDHPEVQSYLNIRFFATKGMKISTELANIFSKLINYFQSHQERGKYNVYLHTFGDSADHPKQVFAERISAHIGNFSQWMNKNTGSEVSTQPVLSSVPY